MTGKQVRALVVQGMDEEYEQYLLEHRPELLPPRGPELLDRADMDNAAQSVTFVPIANPIFASAGKEDVAVGSHTRKVS